MSKKKGPELPKPVAIGLIALAVVVFGGIVYALLQKSSSDVIYDNNYKEQQTGKGRRAPAPPGGYPSSGSASGPAYQQPNNRPPGAGTPIMR